LSRSPCCRAFSGGLRRRVPRRASRSGGHGVAGFTLIEVLVALAVVSISVVAIDPDGDHRARDALDRSAVRHGGDRAGGRDRPSGSRRADREPVGDLAGHRWRSTSPPSLPISSTRGCRTGGSRKPWSSGCNRRWGNPSAQHRPIAAKDGRMKIRARRSRPRVGASLYRDADRDRLDGGDPRRAWRRSRRNGCRTGTAALPACSAPSSPAWDSSASSAILRPPNSSCPTATPSSAVRRRRALRHFVRRARAQYAARARGRAHRRDGRPAWLGHGARERALPAAGAGWNRPRAELWRSGRAGPRALPGVVLLRRRGSGMARYLARCGHVAGCVAGAAARRGERADSRRVDRPPRCTSHCRRSAPAPRT